jgi:PHD/YefM family antitoxin component YafN of YafNO toxin-antitoxin module
MNDTLESDTVEVIVLRPEGPRAERIPREDYEADLEAYRRCANAIAKAKERQDG